MRSVWRIPQGRPDVSETLDTGFGQSGGVCGVPRRTDELCHLPRCRAPGACGALQLWRVVKRRITTAARGLDADSKPRESWMGQGHRRGTCRTLNGQASQSWARLLVSSVRRCALSPGAGASFTFCHLRRGGCMKCGTHFAAVAWRLYARSLNRKSAWNLLRVVGVVVGRRVLFRPIAPRGCESWLTARESLAPEC